MADRNDSARLKELNEQLRFLLGIVPKNGIYLYEGTRYNKRGYEDLLKKTRDEIDSIQDKTSGAEVAAGQKKQEDLTARADKLTGQYNDLSAKMLDIEQAIGKAKSVEEETNLRAWVSLIKNSLNGLNTAISNLRKGIDYSVPPVVSVPSLSQAKVSGPPGPATGQEPVTPVAPVAPAAPEVAPAPGVVQPSPLTAGQRGEAGIMQGTGRPAVTPETPVVETPVVETPAVTTAPGVTPAPVTTPAPGAPQYTPGQEIGGPDRVLPDGGAVVDGRYIPPGIDYTWLANQAPEDWKQAAKELYGAYYEMIKNDPEISKLLEDAIKNEYSDAQFQAKLEQTNWWRTTTANARQFEILETTDPATARAQLDNRISLVRETAQRLGITLGAESLESIARNAINLGFELTAQVEDLVGSEAIRSAGGMSQLRYGYVGNSIRESARKFGVALSDVTFNEWVNKIAVGSESTETFESYAQQIARNLYPSLNDGFDRGLSFAQMTDPYAQVASRILEIPSTQVDFTDPKWAQAFTMTDASGKPAQMSFGEWADYLRTTPSFGYQYTDDAKSKAYNVVSGLARAFGAG